MREGSGKTVFLLFLDYFDRIEALEMNMDRNIIKIIIFLQPSLHYLLVITYHWNYAFILTD